VNRGNIEGVIVKPLRRILDERGSISHMLRADDELFEKFGEIYFSSVNPGVVKGWHIHKEMTLNYVCIHGSIKLVLYDDRADSKSKGNLMEIFLGNENYSLVKVPPKVWNGFKGIGLTASIVANCSTIPHDPKEIERMDPFKNFIQYDWTLKHG